jgi:hypothetical protein
VGLSWLNAYRALQCLGFNPVEADEALDTARKTGLYEIASCRVVHHEDGDTFDVTDLLPGPAAGREEPA